MAATVLLSMWLNRCFDLRTATMKSSPGLVVLMGRYPRGLAAAPRRRTLLAFAL
jgi:hypothetical protein